MSGEKILRGLQQAVETVTDPKLTGFFVGGVVKRDDVGRVLAALFDCNATGMDIHAHYDHGDMVQVKAGRAERVPRVPRLPAPMTVPGVPERLLRPTKKSRPKGFGVPGSVGLKDAILRVLQKARRPMTRKEIILRSKLNKNSIGPMLLEMAKAGEVDRVGFGTYAFPGITGEAVGKPRKEPPPSNGGTTQLGFVEGHFRRHAGRVLKAASFFPLFAKRGWDPKGSSAAIHILYKRGQLTHEGIGLWKWKDNPEEAAAAPEPEQQAMAAE